MRLIDHDPSIGLEQMAPISQEQLNRVGGIIRRYLIENNVLFTPPELGLYLPGYRNFKPLLDDLMYQRQGSEQEIKKSDQIFLMLSGIPAAGKHDVLEALETLLREPSVGLITDTTRLPKEITVRENGKPVKIMENNGVHHNFLTVEQFEEKIRKGEYIEWIEQRPGEFYGTPITSAVEAFRQKERVIITDLEIASGWPKMLGYVNSLPLQDRPRIVRVFLLPGLTAGEYFVNFEKEQSWLQIHRPKNPVERSIRAAGETFYASQITRTHAFLVNPIHEGKEALSRVAQALADTIQRYSTASLLRTR